MVIEKIFSDAAGQEKVYSVVLSKEEYVLFSKTKKEKHTKEWYDGEETENQKKARKAETVLSAGTMGGITTAGASIKSGEIVKDNVLRKAGSIYNREIIKSSNKARSMTNAIKEKMGSPEFVRWCVENGKRPTAETGDILGRMVSKASGLDAVENFGRRAKNLAIRKGNKAAAITAGVGTLGTVGLGLAVNQKIKKLNQEENRKRRNKRK